MKTQTAAVHSETHAFCPVCGRPFTEAEKVVADHTNNFQCHHCWRPVRKITAHGDPHFHATHSPGRLIPVAGKRRR